MKPRMIKNLTKHQIAFACALPIEPKLVKKIRLQAEIDGYPGNQGDGLKRVNWKSLVDLEIAQNVGSSYQPSLKRGKKWCEFYETYGLEATENGLKMFDLEKEIRKLFMVETSEARIIPFPLGGR